MSSSTPPPSALQLVRFDDSAQRPPSAVRPVRSRARPLAMDTQVEPHAHPWSQFTYCASGLMQVTVSQSGAQTTYIVPPSRALWIPAQIQHQVVILEAAELRTVDVLAAGETVQWSECRVLVVSPLLRELIHALEDSQPGERDDALMALTLDEIRQADLQSLGVPMPHPDHGDKRLRTLCAAVLRNPAERPDLKAWVRHIGASERTMARLFREELGTSYQQWRLQAVLAHALPQLARGVPVSVVASDSGYASDSAFSAMFKKAMGKAPRHFMPSRRVTLKN
jgi:AraC-like DNA-binding protein